MDLDRLTELSVKAARAGGSLLLRAESKDRSMVHRKGDYRTRSDLISDEAISEVLKVTGIDILSEEGNTGVSGENAWVVDPLDGTWNYSHGGSWWSVSIALMDKGRPVVGVVYAPLRSELYVVNDDMALPLLNGKEIEPDPSPFIDEWIVSLGAPSSQSSRSGPVLGRLAKDIPSGDPKRPFRISTFLPGRGSMALELCGMACGRLNGMVRFGQAPWDLAAGHLIAVKAGCSLESLDRPGFSPKYDIGSAGPNMDVIGAVGPSNLETLRSLIKGSYAV